MGGLLEDETHFHQVAGTMIPVSHSTPTMGRGYHSRIEHKGYNLARYGDNENLVESSAPPDDTLVA